MGVRELSLPPFFDASNAGRFGYRPDAGALLPAAARWRRAHDVALAAADARNVHLVLIDVQKDFCFPEGSLYVGGRSGTGAVDDTARIARFIYRNLRALTHV